ncbi:hypothetical protein NQ317_002873 [Molorchus minor]|uniref:CCHC-type domain-containing protein n=1 Tax=Molorchus minor TaxID=1323400 RepID=A0ABQ9ITM8_9CUCU|nr:hypothetical protein NQ317_002873 [Molorchus minor]
MKAISPTRLTSIDCLVPQLSQNLPFLQFGSSYPPHLRIYLQRSFPYLGSLAFVVVLEPRPIILRFQACLRVCILRLHALCAAFFQTILGYFGSRKGQRESIQKTKRDTKAILVSQDGKSHAELLKTVKETVKAGTTAARGIRTIIREGKDGRMIIVTEEKEQKAVVSLKKKLRERGNMTTKDIGGQGKKCIIYIKDIDALVEKAEKEEAVGRETGLDKTRFDLFKERAEDLQRKGGIRIGLNRCKVVGRVEVLQCYKCWRYGHIRKKCTENTAMRTACSKCGKEAHAAKECTNKEYCQSCKAENHRMGTAKCPEFKAALSKARAEDAQRKSLND